MLIHYLTKGTLIRAAQLGEKRQYNRQIDPKVLDDLDDVRFPVWMAVAHHHRQGRPCRTHVRMGIEIKFVHSESWFPVIIDVPVSFYADLPAVVMDEAPVIWSAKQV